MIYNNFDFSGYFVDEDIRESILPETVHTATDIPGADGQLFQSARLGTRTIEIDARVIRRNRRELNEVLPLIAQKLYARKPSPLYTRLHNGEYYKALLSGTVDIEKWLGTGGCTLTFIAYDPVRFADGERASSLGYAARDVNILGNYPANPVIEVDIPAPCSYVAVLDLTTGLQIRSEYSFKAGNRVVFDCTTGTEAMKTALLYATKDSTTPSKLAVTPQSRWFELEPGVHSMRILAPSSAVSGRIRYVERRL